MAALESHQFKTPAGKYHYMEQSLRQSAPSPLFRYGFLPLPSFASVSSLSPVIRAGRSSRIRRRARLSPNVPARSAYSVVKVHLGFISPESAQIHLSLLRGSLLMRFIGTINKQCSQESSLKTYSHKASYGLCQPIIDFLFLIFLWIPAYS